MLSASAQAWFPGAPKNSQPLWHPAPRQNTLLAAMVQRKPCGFNHSSILRSCSRPFVLYSLWQFWVQYPDSWPIFSCLDKAYWHSTSLCSWMGQSWRHPLCIHPTHDNLTDCLTKLLPHLKFQELTTHMGMCNDLQLEGGCWNLVGKVIHWCYHLSKLWTYWSTVCGSMWTQTSPLSHLSHTSSTTEVSNT